MNGGNHMNSDLGLRVKSLRYLAVATWMSLALAVMVATVLHVARGESLELSTAFEWTAAIAQVGAFLIVAVHWHEQLVLIETLARRMDRADAEHRQLVIILAHLAGRVDEERAGLP